MDLMKILFFIDSLGTGGKERRLIELLKTLYSKRIPFELIILSDKIEYDLSGIGTPKIHIFKRSLTKDIFIIRKFSKVLSFFKPDIVHGWDNIGSIHFSPLCFLKGIPFINSSISAAPPKLSLFSKRYLATAISYPFSSVVLTNSHAGLESFRVPLEKRLCIHNGFDMDRIENLPSKEEVLKKFNISSKYVIGMTASFSSMKDYPTYIKAALLLLKERHDVTFIAIGDGPQKQKIVDSVPQSLSHHFRFVGRQSNVESIINILDIGVLATYTEGISNSIMEYMALGKPVIATRGGGTEELVQEGFTGFLVASKHPAQITEKIEYLLSNAEIANQMGEKGKERIEKHFSITENTKKLLELYHSVLAKCE